MISHPTDRRDDPDGRSCPEKMSVPYICLIAVVAVLAGVVLSFLS